MGLFDKLKTSDDKTKSKARSIIEAHGSPGWGGLAAAAYAGDDDIDYKDTIKTYERYGINPRDYASAGAISQGRSSKPSSKEMHAELTRRANNDYHSNEAIKAAALRGDKDAQYFAKNGVSSSYDMVKREKLLAKLHKENGHDGNFNSIHDRSRLSYRENKKLIKAGEEKYGAWADDRYQRKSALDEMQDKIVDEAVGVPSPELLQANEGITEYESGLSTFGDSIFGGDDLSQATAEAATHAGGSSDAAQGYLNDYTANVAGGLRLSGVQTRGPKSGIRPGEGF